eukprot:SAG31_NODE_4382_length_3284_cov_2.953218_1_plen_97_part_00
MTHHRGLCVDDAGSCVRSIVGGYKWLRLVPKDAVTIPLRSANKTLRQKISAHPANAGDSLAVFNEAFTSSDVVALAHSNVKSYQCQPGTIHYLVSR